MPNHTLGDLTFSCGLGNGNTKTGFSIVFLSSAGVFELMKSDAELAHEHRLIV